MPAQMTDVDVVVIGAGCGGLSAATLLAGQGRRVLVLDQNDAVGGCASSFERGGYTFDVAASIFEVLEPLKRTLAMLGTSVEQEIDLLPCDPTCAVALRDGKRITFPMGGTVEALSELSVEDARNWSRYASYCEELYDALLETLYVRPVSTLGELVGVLRKRPALVKYLPTFFTSYQAVLGRYFSDRTQQALAFQALTLGLPPALLPGIYSFLPYGELRSPHYPRGGMIQIPRTLQRLGERHGMRVQLGARVTKVLVERRRAIGVQLADGTEIRSDVVVSNINAKTLYQNLIGYEHLPWLVHRGVRSYRYDNACPMVYLGVDYVPPLTAHHTFIAPTLPEINGWWRGRAQRPIPQQQFGMIDWPTFSDPALAPEGKHVLSVTVVGTYQGVDWDRHKTRFVDDVVTYLSRELVPGLADHVTVAACATPIDFERRIGLAEGGLHGITQDAAHTTVFRPSNKSKSIDGLYLAGSSTHPGGGVPTVIASGAIAANLIERHEN